MVAIRLLLLVVLLFSLLSTGAQEISDDGETAYAFYATDSVLELARKANQRWSPFFKGEKLLAGLYILKVGEIDEQEPHEKDELYYILRGRAKIMVDKEERVVSAGDVIFVKARIPHRFFDIKEDLEVLVVFDQ